MILQYIGHKPKLMFDPPWLLGGPYMFDPDVEEGCCEVHPSDGADMFETSPRTFRVISEGPGAEVVDPGEQYEEEPDVEEEEEEILVVEEDTPEVAPAADGYDSNSCFICGRLFASATGLKRHMTVKHPEIGSGGI